ISTVTPNNADGFGIDDVKLFALDCNTHLPQCSDGVDNDNDTKIDAADPGCHTDGNPANTASYDPQDNDETDPVLQCKPVYTGTANVTFFTGHPQSNCTHVSFPRSCQAPSIVTQTYADSILCGTGGGPSTCVNNPSTSSDDL